MQIVQQELQAYKTNRLVMSIHVGRGERRQVSVIKQTLVRRWSWELYPVLIHIRQFSRRLQPRMMGQIRFQLLWVAWRGFKMVALRHAKHCSLKDLVRCCNVAQPEGNAGKITRDQTVPPKNTMRKEESIIRCIKVFWIKIYCSKFLLHPRDSRDTWVTRCTT